jgi:hypothetical protein
MSEISKLQGLTTDEIASVAGISSDSITSVDGILWPAGSYILTIGLGSGSGNFSPWSGYPYLPDDELSIYAWPNSGWSFLNWTGDTDNIVDANASSTNLIPDLHEDTEIYANFGKTNYTLTIDVATGVGSVSPVTGTTYNYDTGLAIEATPAGGNIFSNWTGQTSKIINTIDPTTNLVSPLYSNTTIRANFVATSGTLTYSSDSDVTLRYNPAGPSWTFYSTIPNVYVGANTSYSFTSIVHFSGINIPQGSVIEQVWVDVIGYTSRVGEGAFVSFNFEDSPNPTIPVSTADYKSRVTNCGENHGNLYPDPWAKEAEYLLTMRFYNPYFEPYWFDSLRDCLQYLIDRYGGVSSINLLCSVGGGTGISTSLRDWYSVNGNASKATKLKIAYHV